MRLRKAMRRQQPLKGRRNLGAAAQREVHAEVERTAARFGCSKALVINSILADVFGIQAERYDVPADEASQRRARMKAVR